MKNIKWVAVAVIVLLSVSCNKSKSDKFDYGSYENGSYTNTFFNLQLEIPADWHMLSQEQNAGLMDKSDELVAGENKTLQRAIETSKVTTVILLTASQYGLEVPDSVFNPNIMLLAENLDGSEKIKSASDYLLVTRNALQQDPTPKEFPFPSFQTKKVDEFDFSQMRVITKFADNQTYTQDYYVNIQRDFALSFILTYSSEVQKVALEQVLNTLQSASEK